MARSPEEVATGLLRISIGGAVREMPTLKAKWVADWAALFTVEEGEPKPLSDWTTKDVNHALLSGATVSRVIDLIVAYDRTGALGGREWLDENADPQELHAMLALMVGNAFPLADDPAGLAGLVILRQVVPSAPPNSTNGASTTGPSTRTRSARGSTRSS